jgi:hypothetical protein
MTPEFRDGMKAYSAGTIHRPLADGRCEHTWRNRTRQIFDQCAVSRAMEQVTRLLEADEARRS